MKTLLVFSFVLAGISLAASQMAVTPAVIKAKGQVITKNYGWYQKIDQSHGNVYISMFNTIKKSLTPLIECRAGLLAAYNDIPSAGLSPDVATTFTGLVNNIDNILSQELMNSMNSQIGMYYFNDPMSMLGQTANFFQMSISMKFSMLTMSFYNETCALKMLSKFVPTYEPYAEQILANAEKAIQQMPTIFTNLTLTTSNALIEVQGLTKKIKLCQKSLSPNVCIDQINQQYPLCANISPCAFDTNFLLNPRMEISQGMQNLSEIFSTYPMPNMNLENAFMELATLCYV
jgi:hypothetical protein